MIVSSGGSYKCEKFKVDIPAKYSSGYITTPCPPITSGEIRSCEIRNNIKNKCDIYQDGVLVKQVPKDSLIKIYHSPIYDI